VRAIAPTETELAMFDRLIVVAVESCSPNQSLRRGKLGGLTGKSVTAVELAVSEKALDVTSPLHSYPSDGGFGCNRMVW
jgi:hypothetical protein